MEDGAWQTHTHTDVQNEVHCIGIAVSGNTLQYAPITFFPVACYVVVVV